MLVTPAQAYPAIYNTHVAQSRIAAGSVLMKLVHTTPGFIESLFTSSGKDVGFYTDLQANVPYTVVARSASGGNPVPENNYLFLQTPSGDLVELDAFLSGDGNKDIYLGLRLISTPFAMLEEVVEGTALVADDGFTCVAQHEALIARMQDNKLYFECGDGHHWLEPQTEGAPITQDGNVDYYIGLALRDPLVGYYRDDDGNLFPAYRNTYSLDPYTIVNGEYYSLDRDGDLDTPLGTVPPLGTKLPPGAEGVVGDGIPPVMGPALSGVLADLFGSGMQNPDVPFPWDMFAQTHKIAWTRFGYDAKRQQTHHDELVRRLRSNQLTLADFDFICMRMFNSKIEAVIVHLRAPDGQEMIGMASDRAAAEFLQQENTQQAEILRNANPQVFDDWVHDFLTTLDSLQVIINGDDVRLMTARAALTSQRNIERREGIDHGPTDMPRASGAATAKLVAEQLAQRSGNPAQPPA